MRRRAPRRTRLTVLNPDIPYVICDNIGNPVTRADAKRIIAERWAVTEEVPK